MTPRSKWTNCKDCPLYKFWGVRKVPIYSRTKLITETIYREVPYRGSKTARLLIVGESPGATEVLEGKPFVGDAGQLSSRVLKEAGIDEHDVFYANSCRCLIPKQELSKTEIRQALQCCRPALIKAIEFLEPKLIICYGDIALTQVLKQQGITKKRGIFQFSKEFNRWVLPTFHPAFCLRDMKQLVFFKPDLVQARRFLNNELNLTANTDQTTHAVESINEILAKENIVVAVDTETQGLDWMDPNSVVISYSVSADPKKGLHVQLLYEAKEDEEYDFEIMWPRKQGKNNKKPEPSIIRVKKAKNYDQKIAELSELLARTDIKKVMMNGNYDIHRFRSLGINTINSYCLDIQLAFHLLDPDMHKQASLATIQRALFPEMADYKEVFSQTIDKSDILAATRDEKSSNLLCEYAARDAATTLKCAYTINEQLKAHKFLINYYTKLAHPVTTKVLFEIERQGILFDAKSLTDAKAKIAAELRQKEQEFLTLLPQKVIDKHRAWGEKHRKNGCALSRKAFIIDAFFSRAGFGLKPKEFTPTGAASTNRKILERLLDELDAESKAYEALMTYKAWSLLHKLYTTYLKGFEAAVKRDGRLHTHITKITTATGRTSSSSPNLQNVPKRNKTIAKIIRRLLIAPEGKVLVAADYSQQELRWIAHRSCDSEFVRVYRCNDDIHLRTALELLKEQRNLNPTEEEIRRARLYAKSVNFGIVYGMQAKKFQTYARDEYGIKLTLDEAEQWRKTFFQTYSGILKWHENEIEFARKHGFCLSPFGFRRLLPNITSQDFQMRSQDERYAINTPIQSAGSDTTLLAALHAMDTGLVDNRRAKLVLFIHDELIFEVDEDFSETFIRNLVQCMESINERFRKDFGFEMRVPLKASVEYGKNLADMVEYE